MRSKVIESVKRTTEIFLTASVVRLTDSRVVFVSVPSTKVLGYVHSSAHADCKVLSPMKKDVFVKIR